MFDSNQFFSGGAADFYPKEIDQSLRFNDDDSAYLSRTPASAGDRKTWTLSCWVKRAELGSENVIFAAGANATSATGIAYFYFTSGDALSYYRQFSGSGDTHYITNAVFRDPSAWYHIVVVEDTNNASIKIYVNGVEQSFSLSTGPSNTNSPVNSTEIHTLGKRSWGTGGELDAYLAEVHFTDGTAYTADAFGEFKEGVWVAKAPSVTYGTNGFYLDFANSADIGNDVSGEGNDWTPNNFTASDVVLDSPTDNFATLNPLNRRLTTNAPTYSDGNLVLQGQTVDGQLNNAIATIQNVKSGKYYAEMTVISIGNSASFGVADDPIGSNGLAAGINYHVRYDSDGDKSIGSASGETSSSYGASYTTGDVIGLAVDIDTGTIEFFKNGVSQGTASSDLATNMVEGYTIIGYSGQAKLQFNFGQQDFDYTPPTGHLALSTANLPDPAIDPAQGSSPTDYFNAVLYPGDGTAIGSGGNAITGVGFQPDLVWIKERSGAASHGLYDVVRGVTEQLESDTTAAETTESEGLTAFGTDGFTVGSLAQVNTNTDTYVAWNWKANGSASTIAAGSIDGTNPTIASDVSANTESGFSIMTYTGNGTNGATVGHGLSQAPEFVIVKPRNQAENWNVQAQGLRLNLNLTGAGIANYLMGFGASTVTLTDLTYQNGNGYSMLMYAFHSVEGFSKFGQYEGGSSPFVYTGFRPALIWIKSIDSTSDWYCFDDKRLGYNVDNDFLELNDSEDEDTADLIDILSNGFKIRGSSGTDPNVSETYIYACWASNPFKYSNAR